MALTELQLPSKTSFYAVIQSMATEMDNLVLRWKNAAEFIAMVDSVDLDAMGVAAGQVRVDLNEFKAVIDDIVLLYEGNNVTPINAPNSVIDKIRVMR